MTRTSLLLDLAGVLFLGVAFALDHWAAAQVPDIVRGLLYGIGAGALIASLLHLRSSRGSDMSTPALRRRYLREMIPLAIGYAVAVLGSVTLLRHVDGTALRAMIAAIAMARSICWPTGTTSWTSPISRARCALNSSHKNRWYIASPQPARDR